MGPGMVDGRYSTPTCTNCWLYVCKPTRDAENGIRRPWQPKSANDVPWYVCSGKMEKIIFTRSVILKIIVTPSTGGPAPGARIQRIYCGAVVSGHGGGGRPRGTSERLSHGAVGSMASETAWKRRGDPARVWSTQVSRRDRALETRGVYRQIYTI